MYVFIYFLVEEGHAYHSADLEVRGQLNVVKDIGSFLPPCRSWEQTQVVGFVSVCLYPSKQSS